MKAVLTLVHPREVLGNKRLGLAPEAAWWADCLDDFDAVSVRMRTWVERQRAKKLLDLASAHGCERHGWNYAYLDTVASARREARKAAGYCKHYRLSGWWLNCERHWHEAKDVPEHTAIAFEEEFRACAPGVQLFFNGFWADQTSRERGSRPAATKRLVSRFDAWAPMIYGTRRTTISRSWRSRVPRWRPDLPSLDVAPMVGVGRVDPNGAVWGYSHGSGGLTELVKLTRPQWLAFYYGNGACGAITRGNIHHEALCSLVPRLKAIE